MPSEPLAARLKELRLSWPEGGLTQRQLAGALGVSVPLVSAWENGIAAPPPHRLKDYARLFSLATAGGRPRLPAADEHGNDEGTASHGLLKELLSLRGLPGDESSETAPDSPLRYPPGQAITIVCSELPARLRSGIIYADANSPDFVESYKFADLDALLTLLPRVCALNPTSVVTVGTWGELSGDDITANLIALGGVDVNPVIEATLTDLDNLPVSQLERPTDQDTGGFQIRDRHGAVKEVRPLIVEDELREDVAQFVRVPSPFNRQRTIMYFSGQFSRGTYGVVRTLTDSKLGERNAAYLRQRFGSASMISIVCRVRIVANEVVVPDWTVPDNVLHEWPLTHGEG